jgi:hypothetical protein
MMTTSARPPHAALAASVAAVLSLALARSPLAGRVARATDAPGDWDGSVNLYREGVFTTQRTWLWCTAAGVQIVRNIAEGDEDHSRAGQERYFDWMRTRNRYDLPESAGVDPAGWTAGLRRFVDDRYRLVASRSLEEAVRSAARNLRLTGLPVAITVADGGHGWIMTGFEATADPLATDDFQVTSVRVVGPLYGRQSRDGYDMPPDTRLTVRQLRRFFTPWRYAPLPMVWDGRYVSIQPVVTDVAVAAPVPTAAARDGRAATWPRAPRRLVTFAIAGPSIR